MLAEDIRLSWRQRALLLSAQNRRQHWLHISTPSYGQGSHRVDDGDPSRVSEHSEFVWQLKSPGCIANHSLAEWGKQSWLTFVPGKMLFLSSWPGNKLALCSGYRDSIFQDCCLYSYLGRNNPEQKRPVSLYRPSMCRDVWHSENCLLSWLSTLFS